MVATQPIALSAAKLKSVLRTYLNKDIARLPKVRPWLGSICYLPSEPGVYFLVNEDQDVLYVGSSVDIKNRLAAGSHDGFCKVVEKCGSDFWIYWLPYRPSNGITANDPRLLFLEQSYIDKFTPPFNVVKTVSNLSERVLSKAVAEWKASQGGK